MEEKPNYYAIIPADVRYDKDLPPMAKLLYGEITCLTQKNGFCWATNAYFAELYGMSKDRISKLIGILEKKGYISVHIERNEKNEVVKRYIKLNMIEITIPSVENTETPQVENNEENNINLNNTRMNNINLNIPHSKQKNQKHIHGKYQNVFLSDEELQKLNNEYGYEKTTKAIQLFSEAIEMKGYKYKSHYLAMKKWVFKALEEQSRQVVNKKFGSAVTQSGCDEIQCNGALPF